MKKQAFTLLEMVIVIAVISIISVMSMSQISKDDFKQAQLAILSDIKYTQSLALRDNKHSLSDPKWQRKFWRIIFSTCRGGGKYYMIGSDFDTSGAGNSYFAKSEAAMDLTEGKPLWWYNAGECGDSRVSSRIFITKKYGITDVKSYGGCSTKTSKMGHLGFDYMGRPHYGFGLSKEPNNSSYIKTPCRFEFTFENQKKFSIVIEPESGYAHIE